MQVELHYGGVIRGQWTCCGENREIWTQTHMLGEHHMTTMKETKLTRLQVKDCQVGWQALEGSSSKAFRKIMALPILISEF